MESLSPVVFTWDKPCTEAFVSGDFNQFALTELEGFSIKSKVIWIPPGTYYFRYMIDGSYITSEHFPSVPMYGRKYHQLVVELMPPEMKSLMSMTAEELEKFDGEMFCIETDSETSDISDDEEKSAQLQATPIRRVSAKFDELQLRTFFPVKAAITKIQAAVRMFLAKKQYLKDKNTQFFSRSSTMSVWKGNRVRLHPESLFARVISANILITRGLPVYTLRDSGN